MVVLDFSYLLVCTSVIDLNNKKNLIGHCCFEGVSHKNICAINSNTMFSSIFGKRRSSPVEDETPPIPGARQDDGFVVVDPMSPRGNIYPSISGNSPYPQRPAPAAPKPLIDPSFHYLQGVPFTMSKELQMATRKDTFATEIGDILAFLSSKVNMSGYEYDFSTERSVLKEC